ncbi:unnamed protein product, partial [Dovyalis caffra]
ISKAFKQGDAKKKEDAIVHKDLDSSNSIKIDKDPKGFKLTLLPFSIENSWFLTASILKILCSIMKRYAIEQDFTNKKGNLKDHKVFTCRLIDRSLCLTMLEGFYHEVEILSRVLRYDDSFYHQQILDNKTSSASGQGREFQGKKSDSAFFHLNKAYLQTINTVSAMKNYDIGTSKKRIHEEEEAVALEELARITHVLPDPIIHHILSFLPTKDVVRLQILSRSGGLSA